MSTTADKIATAVRCASLRELADSRRPTNGACAICGKPAASWHRATTSAGLVRAARACKEHETSVVCAIDALTLDDCVRLAPRGRSRRIAAAEAAERRAERLGSRSEKLWRASAAMAGASSHTHTARLFACSTESEASALREYAAALRNSANRLSQRPLRRG